MEKVSALDCAEGDRLCSDAALVGALSGKEKKMDELDEIVAWIMKNPPQFLSESELAGHGPVR